MKDSNKQKKILIIFVSIFMCLCILSPFAFSTAYFTDDLSFTGSGKTVALYVDVKSEFDTTERTITIDSEPVQVDAFVFSFSAINTNELKNTYQIENPDKEQGGFIEEVENTPIYITNFENYKKKSSINCLLRVKIGIEWEDHATPSSVGVDLEISSTNWVGTQESWVEDNNDWDNSQASLKSSILTDGYLYYKSVVVKNSMTAGEWDTYIPLINSIVCNNSLYLNKSVAITVYAEVIQANTTGLNNWKNSSTLPTHWESEITANANFSN